MLNFFFFQHTGLHEVLNTTGAGLETGAGLQAGAAGALQPPPPPPRLLAETRATMSNNTHKTKVLFILC